MKNKNFMVLSEDELYAINGGQGVKEDPVGFAIAAGSFTASAALGDTQGMAESLYDAYNIATTRYVYSDNASTKKKNNSSRRESSSRKSSSKSSK